MPPMALVAAPIGLSGGRWRWRRWWSWAGACLPRGCPVPADGGAPLGGTPWPAGFCDVPWRQVPEIPASGSAGDLAEKAADRGAVAARLLGERHVRGVLEHDERRVRQPVRHVR